MAEKFISHRIGDKPRSYLMLMDKKIIMLGSENLEILKGYKAAAQWMNLYIVNRSEIHIVLTGFSHDGAKRLFDKLKEMKPEEVHGQ